MTTAYEIRVEGQLTAPTLHSLGCDHCLADAQTMIRIEATPTGLQEMLAACVERGMTVESIVRVGSA
jgi:hypothetical protein